ncbi:MAG: hypothetical protein L7V86_04835 [Verrucomicrobiales bacterium]|nr:hypothetical protein [Verrucomicrobiales bacterium]
MNQRALNQWTKARTPYSYLRSHILQKEEADRYGLTLIDLVLVSNFKGGSATIAEPPDCLERKLQAYEDKLAEIGKEFDQKQLAQLNEQDLDKVIELASAFCKLARSHATKIDGFGPSFATALLNANFPDLLPILDKRGLSGADVQDVQTNSQGQVIGIESHYPDLIRYFHRRATTDSMTLEEVDKEIFGMELKDQYRPRKKTKA